MTKIMVRVARVRWNGITRGEHCIEGVHYVGLVQSGFNGSFMIWVQ